MGTQFYCPAFLTVFEWRYDLLCRATTILAPRLIRVCRRPSGIGHRFPTLKHLRVTMACQVQGEKVYDGHLVLRLLADYRLFYMAGLFFKGRVMREEIAFSLTHHWRFLIAKSLWRTATKTTTAAMSQSR
jgi:hypothetical protein